MATNLKDVIKNRDNEVLFKKQYTALVKRTIKETTDRILNSKYKLEHTVTDSTYFYNATTKLKAPTLGKDKLTDDLIVPVLPTGLELGLLSKSEQYAIAKGDIAPSIDLWASTIDKKALLNSVERYKMLVNLTDKHMDYVRFTDKAYTELSEILYVSDDEILKTYKKHYQEVVVDTFEKAISVITESYPEHEQKTWDKQEVEARNYLEDATASTPLLDGIIEIRKIDKDLLVSKVIEKADGYVYITGRALGLRQLAEEYINNLSSIEEIPTMVSYFEELKTDFEKLTGKF